MMSSLEGLQRNQSSNTYDDLEDLKKLVRFPKVKKLHFLRHGRTDWEMSMIKFGPKDLPVNSVGIQQVKKSALYICNQTISHIISSNLKRCLGTRNIIVNALPTTANVTVEEESSLRDRNFGDWSVYEADLNELFGKLPSNASVNYGDVQMVIEQKLPPDAETQADFAFRISAAFVKYLTSAEIQTPLFIAHGCVSDVLMQLLGIEGVILDYGGLMTVEFINGEWSAKVHDL